MYSETMNLDFGHFVMLLVIFFLGIFLCLQDNDIS